MTEGVSEEELQHEIVALVMQDDSLRIAIQGHARIEGYLRHAIEEEFGGTMPNELRWLPFKTRVALARALKIIDDATANDILVVADIRHELAHGVENDLTDKHRAALLKQFAEALSESFDLSAYKSRDLLRAGIASTWGSIRASVDAARQRRIETEEALAARATERLNAAQLSVDEVQRLLASDEARFSESEQVEKIDEA